MTGSNSCVKSYPTTGALDQGQQFAEMTRALHGGSRKFVRKNKKMVRRHNNKTKRRSNKMSGGSFFTPYASYPNEFNETLPTGIRELARVAPLDAAFTELPAVERAAGVPMNGGGRKTRKGGRSSRSRSSRSRSSRRRVGGSAPIDEPSMLLRNPTEEMDARLNPQWYTENTVIPNFRGPVPIPGIIPVTAAPPMAATDILSNPHMPKLGGARAKKSKSKSRKYRNRR